METMRQYEMAEWTVKGTEPKGSWVDIDISAEVTFEGSTQLIKGFYAGGGAYKVRFYPEETGVYSVRIKAGEGFEGASFDAECVPASAGQHGMVRACGTHFKYADGTWFYPFGTTVYALSHQKDELVEQTFATLAGAPFNKIRMCLFPKHYDYNHNEPPCFAFQKTEDDKWDLHHPNMEFWERFEGHIKRLAALGIQVDLIVFHPYDRWGFSKFPREDALVYLDYLTRRFSAIPNLWWSLANEYDIMDYEMNDWECFAQYIHDHDPYGHLLSNHEMIVAWDYTNKNTTHICHQIKNVDFVSMEIAKYNKPLMVDECRYEGNIVQNWGNISAKEMVRRFWMVCLQGGYCTHGETYMHPQNILWWAAGGKLYGQSPARIGFLRDIIESLGGPLDFNGKDMDADTFYKMREQIPDAAVQGNPIMKLMKSADWEQAQGLIIGNRLAEGHFEDKAYIKYYDEQCICEGFLDLPEEDSYKVEVIDTWEMTRTVALEGVNGKVTVKLPSKEGMALLATKQS